MKHIRIFEDFSKAKKDELDRWKEEGGNRYEVNFDIESGGVNHLVMMTPDKKGPGKVPWKYGDSFRSESAANREIKKYMQMGYEVVYYGPDLDYAQEIVD